MFEHGKKLHLEPHFCYEYVNRCSCMGCMFMPERHVIENIKRYPDLFKDYVNAEIKINHTWKNKKSLEEIFNDCMDIDDITHDVQLKIAL